LPVLLNQVQWTTPVLFPLNKSFDDPALIEQDHRACEEAISLRDYGYESDSDLEEEEEETSATLQDSK
jgi:hypothetical protein